MKLKIFIFLGFFLFCAVTLRAEESKHTFTGFVFRNGNTSNPEISQPFSEIEKCFAWGKGRVWRRSDEYRCGVDCERDATKQMRCYSLQKEGEKTILPSPSPSESPISMASPVPQPTEEEKELKAKEKKKKPRVLVS